MGDDPDDDAPVDGQPDDGSSVEGSTRERSSVEGPPGEGSSAGPGPWLARLYAVQTSVRRRWALAAVATAVGLVLATIHWSGLVAGGALVGLCWPTLRRAVVAGFGFALVVLAVAAVRFALAGTLGDVLAAWPLVAVAVAAPLVAGPLGGTARGLLPDAPRE